MDAYQQLVRHFAGLHTDSLRGHKTWWDQYRKTTALVSAALKQIRQCPPTNNAEQFVMAVHGLTCDLNVNDEQWWQKFRRTAQLTETEIKYFDSKATLARQIGLVERLLIEVSPKEYGAAESHGVGVIRYLLG
jgi:hypothetical protein